MVHIVRHGVLMGRLNMPETKSPEYIRMAALALAIDKYPESTVDEQIEIARKIAAFYFGEEVVCH